MAYRLKSWTKDPKIITHKEKDEVHIGTKEQCVICNRQAPALRGGLR